MPRMSNIVVNQSNVTMLTEQSHPGGVIRMTTEMVQARSGINVDSESATQRSNSVDHFQADQQKIEGLKSEARAIKAEEQETGWVSIFLMMACARSFSNHLVLITFWILVFQVSVYFIATIFLITDICILTHTMTFLDKNEPVLWCFRLPFLLWGIDTWHQFSQVLSDETLTDLDNSAIWVEQSLTD